MNWDDGRTFAETRYTACKLGHSLVPIKYSACVLKFKRGVAEEIDLGESDATVTCVPVKLRIRNETTIPFFPLLLHNQRKIPEQEVGSRINHDSSSRNRVVAKRDRRPLPRKMAR